MRRGALLGLIALVLAGCRDDSGTGDGASEDAGPSRPVLAVVNYPLAYFAQRLGGDFADVLFEAPADEDPAFWTPNDEQIGRIQAADLIFLNGADYAKWTATTSLPWETTVDTALDFGDALIEVEGVLTHVHAGDEESHSHAGTAFTTWLDMKQAAAHAEAMAKAMIEEWPERRELISKNLVVLTKDLLEIDRGMRKAAETLTGGPIIASHPIYHYWERAYGVKVPSVPWEPEMDLTEDAMAELKKVQEENEGTKFFMWEGEPSPGHAEKLEAVGLKSFVLSPAGNRPASGDFLSVMKANVATLESLAP